MFNKNFILSMMNILLCSSELIISPNKEEVVINEGKLLEVVCMAPEKMNIFFPTNVRLFSDASPTEIFSGLTKKGLQLKVQRRKASYGDTGWYGCIEDSKNRQRNPVDVYVTPDTCGDNDSKWIYVYVKSTKHLFAGIPFLYQDDNGIYHLFEKEGKNVTLPCRPTSPDYKVKLYSNGKELQPTEYDPKRGMIFRNAQLSIPKDLYCLIEGPSKENVERKDFKLTMSAASDAIEVLTIRNDALDQMEVGKDFKINCSALLWDHSRYHLDWEIPQTNHFSTRSIRIDVPRSDQQDPIEAQHYRIVELTIKNATLEDPDEYKCRLYKDGLVTSAIFKLPYDHRRHLELSMDGDGNEYQVLNGTSFTWRVNIDAYPFPEIRWVDPANHEIVFQNYSSNDVISEKFSVDLTSKLITQDYTGFHTIYAKNSVGEKKISFHVVVNSPAQIAGEKEMQLNVSKYDFPSLSCPSQGYPRPKVEWRLYDENQTFIGEGSEYFQDYSFTSTSSLTAFNVSLKKLIPGHVSCRVKNLFGQDTKIIKIAIKDEPPENGSNPHPSHPLSKNAEQYKVGKFDRIITAPKGSSVTMPCIASTWATSKVLKWTHTNDDLTGRITVKGAVKDTWQFSNLTIVEVEKEDEGEYSCEAKMNDGNVTKNHYHLRINASTVASASVILQLSLILLTYFMGSII